MNIGDWRPRRPAAPRQPIATAGLLHEGGTQDWSLEPEVLAFVGEVVGKESNTAETGAGASTVLLATKGCRHHTITASEREIEDIKSLLRERGVNDSNVTFHCGYSHDILPRLSLPPLDLVIIDGGHGFPVPFVDWCYLAPRLKPGGYLIVDDIQLWTGAVLTEFLRAEWQWEVSRSFAKAVAFRKKADPVLTDWGGQPYLLANSNVPANWTRSTNTLHGHIAALDSTLDRIESQGALNEDTAKDLLWVEGELLDCVRRIEGLCNTKMRDS